MHKRLTFLQVIINQTSNYNNAMQKYASGHVDSEATTLIVCFYYFLKVTMKSLNEMCTLIKKHH